MVDTLGICLAGSGKLFKSPVFHSCMLHQVGHDFLVLSTIKMFCSRTLAELTMLLSVIWDTVFLHILKFIECKILVSFILPVFSFFSCYCCLGTTLSALCLPVRVSVCSWIPQGISFQQRLFRHKYCLKTWGSLMDVHHSPSIYFRQRSFVTYCEKNKFAVRLVK